MNQKTYDKLMQNPHYRMSPEQMQFVQGREVVKEEPIRSEMIEFGTVEKHSAEVIKHDVKLPRKNRKRRK
jgi:hypothetical protein